MKEQKRERERDTAAAAAKRVEIMFCIGDVFTFVRVYALH
jgi:hypothetical protein